VKKRVLDGFRAHTSVHLKFLARSRVLLGFGIGALFITGVMMLPAVFVGTSANQFELLKQVSDNLHSIATLITAGIGLFILWSHQRTRTIKLIATRPCSFDSWVASIFAAAAIFGFLAQTAVTIVAFVLSMYWGVPYQIGFVYVSVQWLAQSAIVLAYLTALSACLHPVLAILILAFFNEATFHALGVTLGGAVEAGHTSTVVRAARSFVSLVYYVTPTFTPFAEETREVNRSLHVAVVDWRYLVATIGYAVLVSACAFMATVVILRRRRLT
jgi:hypothetical protein